MLQATETCEAENGEWSKNYWNELETATVDKQA
jgi:hypothetical protein